MSNELEKQDDLQYYKDQQTVVSLRAAGHTETEIQKKTGFTRKVIQAHLEQFAEYSKQDKVIRERSREIVLMADQHYNDIIKEMHLRIEDADTNDDYKAAMQGLKMLADIEAKRIEFLQKAGILADNEIADQIAETERKQAILIDILRTMLCPDCKRSVQKAISEVSGKVETNQ